MNDWGGFLSHETSKGLIYYIHFDQDAVRVAEMGSIKAFSFFYQERTGHVSFAQP